MAETLSLSQAAECYHIGQSTLRKWIKRSILSAELVPVHGKEQYQILVAELERVLEKRGMLARDSTEQDVASQDERIDELEKRVAALEREIAVLRQATRPPTLLSDLSAPAPPLSVREPRQTFQPTKPDVSGDLPVGWVSAAQFCRLHFPNKPPAQSDRFLQTLRMSGSVPMHGPRKIGQSPKAYALDKQGQQQFYQVASSRDGWQMCESCPHDE